jgi:hypothetical protein
VISNKLDVLRRQAYRLNFQPKTDEAEKANAWRRAVLNRQALKLRTW